jgi:signal peptidase I
MEMTALNSVNSDIKENELNNKPESKGTIMGWVRFIVLLLAAVILIPKCIGFTSVSGFSMMPTIQNGSLIFEEKISKYFKEPQHGDVVTINQPEQGYKIVKRVIGLPNDTVEIREGIVLVNSEPIAEISVQGVSPDMEAVKVPEGYMFVMGDNREPGESIDSRDPSVGPMPLENLIGHVVYSLRPFHSIPKPITIE